jgi:VWFA-related protein
VDLVVRDKKGRVVPGLKAGQVQVFEDGKPQAITSFRFVDGRRELAAAARSSERAEPAAAGAGAAQPVAAPASRPHLVSLVFSGMEPFSRILAGQAARLIVNSPMPPNTWLAVFSLDNRLNVLQSFTTDRAALNQAVELAVSGQPSQFRQLSQSTERELKGLFEPRTHEGVGLLPSAIEFANQATGRTADNYEITMARMLLQVLDFTQATSEYHASTRTLFGLQALVRAQAALPGRKTVVYMAEGLYIHPERKELFAAVLSAANQAHVSVYAIDVRALESTSSGQAVKEALAAAATASRIEQQEDVTRRADSTTASRARAGVGVTYPGDPVTTRDKITVFDSARDSIQADTQSGMAALAGGTGGFLVANTNDMELPVRAIIEDIGTYYELAYHPAATRDDGRFRRIEVKVALPGVRIQSRAGYLALPTLEQPLLPHELALVRAIESDPRPRALDFHAEAVRLRPEAGRTRHAIVFELPAKDVKVVEDQPAAQYRAHVAFLALIRDASGRAVEKLSRDVPFAGPLDRLPAFRQSSFVHVQPFALPPGRYTVQTAAMDALAGTFSAGQSELVVPAAQDPAIGGIVRVLRLGPFTETAQADPFEFDGRKITPTLSQALRRPARLYFVVSAAGGRPEVSIEFARAGKVVQRLTPALTAPDETGAFPVLADVPAELEPGEWEVQVTARRDGKQASAATRFLLER